MKLFVALMALMLPLMGSAEEVRKPHEVLKAIHGNAHIFLTAKPCPLPGVVEHWPIKGKGTERIDGLVAMVNAMSRAMMRKDETTIYNERGILSVS